MLSTLSFSGQDTVYDRFVELAAERARKRVLGDPYDPKTQQGPQVDGAP